VTEKPRKQEQERATDRVTEVAPGVIRTELPVDMPGLGHVNCYILEDDRGIALIDPGLPGPSTHTALRSRLASAGYKLEDVHTVVITHSHIDHFGGATQLRELTGADILTHESFQSIWDSNEAGELIDLDDEPDDDAFRKRMEERWERSGTTPWGTARSRPGPPPDSEMRQIARDTPRYFATPRPTVKVADSEIVKLGRREWMAIFTPGHTEDHLCLFDPEHGVFFSGDHVLPTITPHIGGMGDSRDPLARFFESLARMGEFEGVKTVLPAHGHPFDDLAGRANVISRHHDERLDEIRLALSGIDGGTVTQFMQVLFRPRSWGDMAESETFAHLEHLRLTGELRADTNADGLTTFHKVEQ
jgi:glyoxylase-like metal-dependent hydrolase (beta-lactamase superfamily II)